MVQTFLISGTPLTRLPFFKQLLESNGLSLPGRNHMGDYIPRIEEREFNRLREEINGSYLGLSFDGTSRLGEAINVVGRFCTPDFDKVHMRLLRFLTAKLHLKAGEFAAVITRIVCTELSVPPEMVVCMSRDSVLVNGAACRLLRECNFGCSEVQMCISHTLNNVGSRLHFSVLSEFMTPWLELVGGRNPHRGAQSLWRQAVYPTSVPGYSHVRWHSLAEIQFVLAEHFDKLPAFLAKINELEYGEATRQKLQNILGNNDKSSQLKLQLAAVQDMKVLVTITYELEGDGLELLLVYDRIERLRALGRSIASGAVGVLPNVDAVLRQSAQLKNGLQIKKVICVPFYRSLLAHGLHSVCCRRFSQKWGVVLPK